MEIEGLGPLPDLLRARWRAVRIRHQPLGVLKEVMLMYVSVFIMYDRAVDD
jgi:hypothetical protein